LTDLHKIWYADAEHADNNESIKMTFGTLNAERHAAGDDSGLSDITAAW